MKDFFNKIRTPDTDINRKQKIMLPLFMLLLGIVLGIFSKWLDNLSIDDTIWWQHLLGVLDLGNVFSGFGIWICLAVAISVFSKTPLRAGLHVFLFFLGMCVSYHLYTILFCGFNPMAYMMIWYGITLLSPILAFICWYGKGKGAVSLVIDIGILTVMLLVSFAIGIWYFDVRSVIDTLLFICTVVILYTNPRQSVYSLIGAICFAYIIRLICVSPSTITF